MSEYPECEKLEALSVQITAVRDFCEWLTDQGVVLAKYQQPEGNFLIEPDEELFSDFEGQETRIMRYFGIDTLRLDDERVAMIEEHRAATN